MEKLDKNKSLKNSNENSSLDSEVSEKERDSSDNFSNSGKSSSNAEHSNISTTNDNDRGTDSSNSFSLDLAVLNEISKIAQMAMTTISCLTCRITNMEMKKQLVAIYSQYSNILLQVNQRFEKYGEIPDNAPLRDKIMGICGVKMNTLRDSTNSHIAEMMIQGTLMGIIECQKLLNSNLNIEKSTIDLLKDFNQFQRQNIDKLNAYL